MMYLHNTSLITSEGEVAGTLGQFKRQFDSYKDQFEIMRDILLFNPNAESLAYVKEEFHEILALFLDIQEQFDQFQKELDELINLKNFFSTFGCSISL